MGLDQHIHGYGSLLPSSHPYVRSRTVYITTLKRSGRCNELHGCGSSSLACLPVGNAVFDMTMAQWRLVVGLEAGSTARLSSKAQCQPAPTSPQKKCIPATPAHFLAKETSPPRFQISLLFFSLIAHFGIPQCFGSQLQVPQANVGRVLDRPTGIYQAHLRRPNR